MEHSQEIFSKFLSRGKSPFDYENIFLIQYDDRVSYLFNGKKPIPFEIEIQPSPYCNAHCTHCWAKDFNRLENKLDKKQNIDRVVDQVLSLSERGLSSPRIKFCGSTGDPLMNKNIGYFIKGFYGKRIMRLFTNGINIGKNLENEKYLNDLSKLNLLYLSLDAGTTETLHRVKPGSKKNKASVEDILEGCKKMKSMNSKLGVNVSYVITNQNYEDIVEAAKKAKDYGMNLIRYRIDLTDDKISKAKSNKIIELLKDAEEFEDENFVVVPIHNEEQIKNRNEINFGSRKNGFNCITSKVWTCIASDGEVYPCGHCVDRDTESYGNILKQDFQDIWNSERKEQVQKNLPGKKCTVCSPFSLRINEFGTFLMDLPENKREELLQDYYKKQETPYFQ